MEDEKVIEAERDAKLPDQKELEKELSDYLSKKYGNRVKIISPFLFPKAQRETTDESKGGDGKESGPVFDMLPEELEAYLDSFVVKQKDAKAVLGTKICTHFNRIKHLKQYAGKKKSVGVGMIKNNVLPARPGRVIRPVSRHGNPQILSSFAHTILLFSINL